MKLSILIFFMTSKFISEKILKNLELLSCMNDLFYSSLFLLYFNFSEFDK